MSMSGHAPLRNQDAFLFNAGADASYQQPQQQGFESQMAWRQWVENSRIGHEAPEYMNPANALMALGGRELAQGGSPQPGHALPLAANVAGGAIPHLLLSTNLPTVPVPEHWPVGVLDSTPNRHPP